MAPGAPHRLDRRLAAVLVTTVVATCGGLVVWAQSVRDRLPDPIASHWGLGGTADGFSSLTSTLVVTIAIVAPLSLVMGAIAVDRRQQVLLRRLLAGTTAFVAAFVTVLMAVSLHGQLDLADATAAPSPGAGIGLGLAVGMVLAVLVGATASEDPTHTRDATGPPPAEAPHLPHVEDDASWEARLPGVDRAALWVAAAAGAVFVPLAVLVSWWLLLFGILVVVAILGTGRVRVRIDREGMTATLARWTILQVPLREVAAAHTTHLHPFREFGGWGLRVDLAGRTALATRAGPALRVVRGDDTEVLVTIDDPDGAAATLNSLVEQLHEH